MKAHHFDKETGKWGVCNAQPGNCPKSPANRHFNSYGQMNQYADGYFNPSIANKELLKEESTELLYGRADGLTDEIAELKTQLADKYTDESSFINELSESTKRRINENAEIYSKNTIAGMNQFLEDEGIIPAYLTNKDGDLYYDRESLDSYICRGMNAIDNNGNEIRSLSARFTLPELFSKYMKDDFKKAMYMKEKIFSKIVFIAYLDKTNPTLCTLTFDKSTTLLNPW